MKITAAVVVATSTLMLKPLAVYGDDCEDGCLYARPTCVEAYDVIVPEGNMGDRSMFGASEEIFLPLQAEDWANVPPSCLPPDAAPAYGAWYGLFIEGDPGVNLDVVATGLIYGGDPSLLETLEWTVSVMEVPNTVIDQEETCAALTCLAYNTSFADVYSDSVTLVNFNISQESLYYIFVSSAVNVTEVLGETLELDISPSTQISECEYIRTSEMNGETQATCTPCETSVIEGPAETTEVINMTCSDTCEICYNTSITDPFCYKESRSYSYSASDSGDTSRDTETCRTFPDGNTVCDARDCPVSINGMACGSCENDYDKNCSRTHNIDNIVASCPDVDPGLAVIDFCQGIGFDEGGVLGGYYTYLDALKNQWTEGGPGLPVVGQCSAGAAAGAAGDLPILQPEVPAIFDLGALEEVKFLLNASEAPSMVQCAMSADTTEDVDLYVSVTDESGVDGYTCYSTLGQSEEFCQINIPTAGATVQVDVISLSSANVTELAVSCQLAAVTNIYTEVPPFAASFSLENGYVNWYVVDVDSVSEGGLKCTLSGDGTLGGDGDLRIQNAILGQQLCVSVGDDSAEECTVPITADTSELWVAVNSRNLGSAVEMLTLDCELVESVEEAVSRTKDGLFD
ncbi:expressed unknown protein [Seminavis robusta]|uniref:Uncharacterized protein n=1 Tax=Seminavis robusta TaxID=568900 RepID=A0A9N8HES9_9STRA|nr:expressed unknown protein [Seminavis robusta]|eukprot:Sro318_g115880.1 n/a (629) ;mRNA; f:17537-19423